MSKEHINLGNAFLLRKIKKLLKQSKKDLDIGAEYFLHSIGYWK